MKSLKESLFDRDIAEKEPIDFSFFKHSANLQYKADAFMILYDLMNNPNAPEVIEDWMGEDYFENQLAFDYLEGSLREAFKKYCDCWVNITENDFEELGGEMSVQEIDEANEELKEFFSKAYLTQTNGYFMIGKGKIPKLIVKLLRDTDYWNPKMSSIDTWAIHYWPDYGPTLSFYGCPKGLNSLAKKLLYN